MHTLTTQAPLLPDHETQEGGILPDRMRGKSMRILFAGAGGMIGSAVAPYLASQGHEIVRLVRRTPGTGEVRWDPDAHTIESAGLEEFDGVVHMASLPQARWTPDFVKRWRDNHVGTNRLLAEQLARSQHKPQVLVCASAQGIYPPAGDEILTEDSAVGTDYLAELLRAGEQATAPASEAGIRVVHLRIPTVLGGANVAAFARGTSRLGSGRQWFSWIAREEMASIVQYALVNDALAGPVNATSPNPVRNAQFFATIGHVLGRKPKLPLPAFLLRLMLGDMADKLILASRRIEPRRLVAAGYSFQFGELEVALRHAFKPQEEESRKQ